MKIHILNASDVASAGAGDGLNHFWLAENARLRAQP